MPDTARNSFDFLAAGESWASLATLSIGITREQQPLVELARLIQNQDDDIAVEEQIQIVDKLVKITTENPGIVELKDSRGMLPLHVAMENELPLECIKILVDPFPESAPLPYQSEGQIQTAILRSSTADMQQYLSAVAVHVLKANLDSQWLFLCWDNVQVLFEFHYNVKHFVERLVQELPDFLRQSLCFRGQGEAIEYNARMALHYAVEQQAPPEILEILIVGFSGALTIKSKSDSLTPLDIAISNGYSSLEVIELLATTKTVRIRTKSTGELPLHKYLIHYESSMDLQVVKLLVDLYPWSVYDRSNYMHRTPLHYACSALRADPQHLAVIRFLVDQYPEALEVKDRLGYTPVACALLFSQEETFSLVVNLVDLHPESISIPQDSGRSLLHLFLLAKGNFDGLSRSTGLSFVESLVDACPSVLQIRDRTDDQWTPLEAVAFSNKCHLAYLKLLVSKCLEYAKPGEPIGIESALLQVCSKAAVLDGDNEDEKLDWEWNYVILNIITMSSVNAIMAKCDGQGQTALHLLCGGGGVERYTYFVFTSLDKYPMAASARDNNGRLPLHALMEGFPESFRASEDIHEYSLIESYLLKAHPIGVHAMDCNGMTPLMLACEKDVSLDMIYRLVRTDPPVSSGSGLHWSQVPYTTAKTPTRSLLWKSLLWAAEYLSS